MILGIETSCDETSVAVITDRGEVRSNLIASQIARHQPFGGVVPEIASREHLEHLMPLIRQSLGEADVSLLDLSAIAVTNGPGLIGALLVGLASAQGLAFSLGLPLAAVNHLEGHVFSPYLRGVGPAIDLPALFWSIVVSGGHSSVYEVRSEKPPAIRALNRTRDDAAGEIFDKVAKVLGLDYPGGPEIDRLASEGDAARFSFPMAQFKDEAPDFSFSGLKSTAIRVAREHEVSVAGEPTLLRDFCASFQRAITNQIVDRLDRLWEGSTERPTEIAVAGGVAANSELRRRVTEWGEMRGLVVRLPERVFCTDNAAMIAFAALRKGEASWGDPRRVAAYSRAHARGPLAKS
jgi:N6-L-threonylcarbamoyladenine synthase